MSEQKGISMADRKLSNWILFQRRCYQKKILSASRIARLEAIPGWKWRERENPDECKAKFLQMAVSGAKPARGKQLNQLKRLFRRDKLFKQKIKSLAPHWFRDRTDDSAMTERKDKILGMALAGEPRPHFKSKIGKWLGVTFSTDKAFRKQLLSIAPHWFPSVKR